MITWKYVNTDSPKLLLGSISAISQHSEYWGILEWLVLYFILFIKQPKIDNFVFLERFLLHRNFLLHGNIIKTASYHVLKSNEWKLFKKTEKFIMINNNSIIFLFFI